MLRALLALALLFQAGAEPRVSEPCTMFYVVRISAWGPSAAADGQPWTVHTFEVGPMSQDRSVIEAKRASIAANGYTLPNFRQPDPNAGDTHITASNILMASVKRCCCWVNIPIPERPPCVYPDGYPPPSTL